MIEDPYQPQSDPPSSAPDEEWARWEATFLEARPVLPDVALERIEAAIRNAAPTPKAKPWYRHWIFWMIAGLVVALLATGWVIVRMTEHPT